MVGRFRKRLRKWWDRYRHYRAAQGLIADILQAFGWKAGAMAILSGVGTGIWGRIRQFTTVQSFVIACAVLTIVLPLSLAVWYALQRHAGRSPSLRFVGWHAGEGSRLPGQLEDKFLSWISVTNPAVAIPIVGKNVTVQIDWINDAGTHRPIVPEAPWYAINRHTDYPTEGWHQKVEIGPGETQSFVFFGKDSSGKLWLYKNTGTPFEFVEPGHWTATISVCADNMRGFKGALGFTVFENGGTRPDEGGFVMYRRLRSRLR